MKLSLLPVTVNNTANTFEMNQLCKVCGEPAAGFHFGAFTCEGCKSFFGRTYNNLSSLNECKNNGRCVINKKNRTSCKACRLRKCLMVGMSKSGSRYGRRSNWFKIHCLMQEQAQALESSALHAGSLGSTASMPGSGMSGASGNLMAAMPDAVTSPGTETFIDRARALGSPGAKLTSSSSPCSDSSYRMPSSPGAASDSADYKSNAALTGGITFGANNLTPPSVTIPHHPMFYDKPAPSLFSPLAAAAAAAAVASNRPLVAPFPPLASPFSTPTSAYAALFPAIYQQPNHKLLLPSAYLPPHLLELYQHHHQQQQHGLGKVSSAVSAALVSAGDSESRRQLLSIVSAGMDNSRCSPCPSSPASLSSSPAAVGSETEQPMDLSHGSSTGSRSAVSPTGNQPISQQGLGPETSSPSPTGVNGTSSDSGLAALTLSPRVSSVMLSVVTETPLDLTAKT